MPDDHEVKRDVEMLRGIESAHELVHIMPFDTICETAGWAADEIERLRDIVLSMGLTPETAAEGVNDDR